MWWSGNLLAHFVRASERSPSRTISLEGSHLAGAVCEWRVIRTERGTDYRAFRRHGDFPGPRGSRSHFFDSAFQFTRTESGGMASVVDPAADATVLTRKRFPSAVTS